MIEASMACSGHNGSLFLDIQGNRNNEVWYIDLGHQKERINDDLIGI